jgi:hypothetical protein
MIIVFLFLFVNPTVRHRKATERRGLRQKEKVTAHEAFGIKLADAHPPFTTDCAESTDGAGNFFYLLSMLSAPIRAISGSV